MTSVIDTRRFGVESFRAKPVARITPSDATGILGTRIQFSGAGSTIEESYDSLTFYWRLSARPVGSAAVLSMSDTSDKSVNLEADITGTYIVSLYVEADGVRSNEVTAAAFFSPAIVPASKRIDVDGSFMFNVLSDFWTLVNDREVFPIVWSGMSQAVASDFLRAVQIDRAKSISTIQPLLQTRWLRYSPEMPLEASSLDIIYGGMQSGEGAFTGSVTFVGRGVVISGREVLITGPTTIRAIGTTMTLFSGSSRGSFLINNLNSDGSGYIVSSATPLAGLEAKTSGVTLVASSAALSEVYDITADFSTVEEGDYLQILSSGNAGYYEIAEVISSTRLRLTESLRTPTSNMRYRVLLAVRASFKSPQTAYTDTVYIPEAEADLGLYDLASLTGIGTIVNNFEIRTESQHVLDSALGARIRITSGSRAGTSLEIATLMQSPIGLVVSSKISGTTFPETVAYTIDLPLGFRDRLIVLDGVAHRVASYELITGLLPEESGGLGNLWAITLESATAPSGRVGIEWRICPTIRSSAVEDFEAEGVSAGDTLEFEVRRTDLEIGSVFRAQVLGARGNEIAFDLGTQPIPTGRTESGVFYSGILDAEDTARVASELSIPTVTLSESGSPIFTASALDIYELLHSSDFRSRYRNLPLDPSTPIDLDSFFRITLQPIRIIRNSRVPLSGEDERPVYSVPALFEYISTERVDTTSDGGRLLVHKDETTSTLSREPIKLSENNEFCITQTEIRGAGLTSRVSSSVISITDRPLVFLGVRPGDELELLSGLSMGLYAVTTVVSETELRISGRSVDGRLPVANETSIEYVIRRRGVGRFIEFAQRFSASDPAPNHLWAPLTFFDNSKYIEDNFGLLVGVTREDLDRYGTTQISYRSAVAGLMYAWASGPTLRSAEIGAQIVLDLPVTEKASEIISIEPEFTDGYGRVIVEELDAAGLGTGIVNVYRYPRADLYSLEKFKGLGVNPLTGSIFSEGDFLPPFTPLTNSVVVSDHVIYPNWWREYSDVPGEVELRKYHSWQVEVDIQAVDSRDLPLVSDFIGKIRPIYTKPTVVAVLSLLDSITVNTNLFIEMDGYFVDDPAFSRESSHAFDDDNGSSLVLRRVDMGSRSTRTLYQGDDLSMEAGSGAVTSARGGFTGDLTELDYVNQYFGSTAYPTGVPVFGKNVVRAGDLLVVLTGLNKAVFRIASVDSSTELTVEEIPGEAPRSIPAAAIVEESGVAFQIVRDADHVICEGTGFSVTDVTTEDAVEHLQHVFVDENASFRSDGVTSDDVLIILSGANRGVYSIQEVGIFDAGSWDSANTGTPELFTDQEVALTLSRPLPDSGASAPYRIERWALQQNPIFSGSAVGTAGQAFVTITDADLMNITRDDRLYDISTLTSAAMYVITAVSGNTVYISTPLLTTISGVEVRKLVFEDSESDSDTRLERLMGYDTVELDIYRPLLLVSGTSGSVTIEDSVAVVPGGTPQVGDILILTPNVVDPDPEDGSTTSVSHGAYEIIEVDGTAMTVDGIFPAAETLSGGVWRADPAAFALDGTTRVEPVDNVLLLGVRPGDFFEYDGNAFPIISVESDHFILPVVPPGGSISVAGRIFRRELPSQGRGYDEG